MECYAAPDQLFVRCRTYSRSCKDADDLADSKRRGKTCGHANKTRKEPEKCRRYYMLKMI